MSCSCAARTAFETLPLAARREEVSLSMSAAPMISLSSFVSLVAMWFPFYVGSLTIMSLRGECK